MELEIPVFAVDQNGALINANGIFNAKFEGSGFQSDCGDCVMVDGIAQVKVSFNPTALARDSSLSLDTSNLKLLSETGEYTTPTEYLWKNLGMGVYGCVAYDASSSSRLDSHR
jgi:hypothetical protein